MLVAVLYVEMDVRGLNGPEYAQVVEDTLAGGDEGKNPGRKLVGKQPRLIGGRAFVELKYEWREDGMPSRMRCLISVLRQHGLRLVCQGPSSLIELKSESIDTLLAGLAVE